MPLFDPFLFNETFIVILFLPELESNGSIRRDVLVRERKDIFAV